MSDELDDDMLKPKALETIEIAASARSVNQTNCISVSQTSTRPQVGAVEKICALVPTNIEEAWRLSEAFVMAGMVPDSLRGTSQKETTARVMLVILKGMEVGFGPVTSIQTIMIINNKPCIYGDGTAALIQKSGKIEYIKTESSGTWGDNTKDFNVRVTMKRKDQAEPYIRSFGYNDAKRAGLNGKKGPWTNYPERQCYWRALSWAARDGAADALMGLQIAEEVQDYITEQKREEKTDTSSLD